MSPLSQSHLGGLWPPKEDKGASSRRPHFLLSCAHPFPALQAAGGGRPLSGAQQRAAQFPADTGAGPGWARGTGGGEMEVGAHSSPPSRGAHRRPHYGVPSECREELAGGPAWCLQTVHSRWQPGWGGGGDRSQRGAGGGGEVGRAGTQLAWLRVCAQRVPMRSREPPWSIGARWADPGDAAQEREMGKSISGETFRRKYGQRRGCAVK